MSSNVVKLELVEVGENFRFDADEILEAAKGKNFRSLMIIAEPEDEDDLYVASSCNAGEAMILMELAKRVIVPE